MLPSIHSGSTMQATQDMRTRLAHSLSLSRERVNPRVLILRFFKLFIPYSLVNKVNPPSYTSVLYCSLPDHKAVGHRQQIKSYKIVSNVLRLFSTVVQHFILFCGQYLRTGTKVLQKQREVEHDRSVGHLPVRFALSTTAGRVISKK